MASKEDDNKLECISNVNKEQERILVNVYKKYDVILNSKTETFEKKIESIIEVWQSIADKNLEESDIRYVTQIMDWAKLHALNIVLTAEWKDHKGKYEDSLLEVIDKVQTVLLKLSTAFSSRFQKLADVVKNPWEGPILVKLLSNKEPEIGPEEIEFFCVETAYLVSYRLKKLCESQCEDLALNLVTAFMRCRDLSRTQNFNLNANETQIWFIFDIYIALLYKFQESTKIVTLFKGLSLEEGLQLIKRFAKKQVKISKIWKHCHKVAVLACQVFLSTAAVKFSEEHRSILENLVECFISICNAHALQEMLTTSLKRISQLADAAGLYVFCDVVHRKAGSKLKPFTIEMYIRALTADLNNLERQKNDNETEKFLDTTKRLAKAFCKLADLLNDHVKVTRECVLTAFSLEPTEERLKRIIELAKRSGFQVLDTGQEWKCKLHPPLIDVKDEVAWICSLCGDWTCKPQLDIPLNTNIALNEALQADNLGISEQLCDDLAVCLSNPRYQVLSWLLPWEDLHRICVMYTYDTERTKNVVTELKFVDIDYSLFKDIKREPLDELAGVERGYEQYLDTDFASDDQMSTISEDSASQDSRPYSLGSDGDTPYLPPTKSDPNTLKSLRMFRPSLKRPRPCEPEQSIPEKLYKMGITDIPPMPSTSKASNSSSNGLPNIVPSFQPNTTYVSPSKNGLAATLPQQCGQVAIIQTKKATQVATCQITSITQSTPQVATSPITQTIQVVATSQITTTQCIPQVATTQATECIPQVVARSQTAAIQCIPQVATSPINTFCQPQVVETRQITPPIQCTPQLVEAKQITPPFPGILQGVEIRPITPPIQYTPPKVVETWPITPPYYCNPQVVETRQTTPPLPEILQGEEIRPITPPIQCTPPQVVETRPITPPIHCSPPQMVEARPITPPQVATVPATPQVPTPPPPQPTTSSPSATINQRTKQLLKINILKKYSSSGTPENSNSKSCSSSNINRSYSKISKSYSSSKSKSVCHSKSSNSSSSSKSSSMAKQISSQLQVLLPMVKLSSISSSHISNTTTTSSLCSSSQSTTTSSSGRGPIVAATQQQATSTISNSTTPVTTVKVQTVIHPPLAKTTSLDLNTISEQQCNNDGISVQQNVISEINVDKIPAKVPEVRAPRKKRMKKKILPVIRKKKKPLQENIDVVSMNINLTENLRTGKKICGDMNIDCVKTPEDGVCKNVNKVDKHSSVVQSHPKFKLKELKIILRRLPEEIATVKPNCIEKRSKSTRRRKCNDKSENKVSKQAPKKRVQIYKLSPLQDINPRVPSADFLKGECDPKKNLCQVLLERLPESDLKELNKKSTVPKSLFQSIPGMDNYEHIRPANVDHIVNVVQISGGRPAASVSTQSSQTSTQVTPHIQRIGQPRTEKPEPADSETPEIPASTNTSAAAPAGKPTTSQPSTLINILSQQIIRPGQSNCVRTRPSPLINILSQQIIRPNTPVVQKVVVTNANNSTPDSQINNVTKVTTTTAETATVNTVKNATTVKNVVTSQTNPQPGTILQFICKSSLPKFQQAFGKSVYTNATETSEAAAATVVESSTTGLEAGKKPAVTKNIPVNVQPIQGSVIYTRQMPVGQTINLIPPGRGQVFRIATSNSDQISLVKDTVIHSKMSALLAAALQGKKTSAEGQTEQEVALDDGTRVTVARPTLVQNARIVKPVLQIPSNVIRTSPQSQSSNLSSTTLEQLREFDMVYKQIKERSSTGTTPAEVNTTTVETTNEATPQRIAVTYVNQGQKYTQLSPVVVVSSAAYCNLQPAASPALSVTSQGSSSPCVTPAPTPTLPKVASKSSKGKTLKNATTTTHASKSSPIPKPQQKPQEDEHTTQRIFDILAEYAEQLRNSPDLNNKPAPRRRSNPPTNPSQNSKRKKSSGKSGSKSGASSTMVSEADTDDQRTMESEDSSCGVVQLSMPEEEPQVQTVTTSETNENSNTGPSRQLILTSQDSSGNTQTRNLIIADSSVGEALKMPNTAVLVPGNYIMPVSMVKGGQQIAVMSGGSKILATVPARSGPTNMLLFQSFLNQNRKTGVPTVKYSTIQPIAGISSQSLAGVSAQPPVILPPNAHSLTAVALGQPLTLKKIEDPDRPGSELLLTIAQPRDTVKIEIPQPDSSTNTLTEEIKQEENSEEKVFTFSQKSIIATPIATPVIAQAIKEEVVDDSQQNMINLDISNDIKDEIKVERVQSVLVTACTSNGPMLSHTPPRYRKPSETITSTNEVSSKEFLHNGEKQNNTTDQKSFATTTVYYQNKNKKSNPQHHGRELLQRKQAALERELRLQKSLSEECEDLGVDEPSTSDLFPEAELLFDSNHSPSFDQTSQDLMKRPPGKSTITLFSDDDNSSSMRTNLFEYVDEYPNADNELVFDPNQQLTNGQSSTSNESASSCCEDNTLLQNCASMSDVTLNSPLSPDIYTEVPPAVMNKYKFKYSNRKKNRKPCETWNAEVSSSEDTEDTETTCTKHICDEDLNNFKVVHVNVSKSDLLKDDESCEELHCDEDLDSPSAGRGARRSVRKTCSCCNGDGNSRKRPHTPAPQKKPPLVNKKR